MRFALALALTFFSFFASADTYTSARYYTNAMEPTHYGSVNEAAEGGCAALNKYGFDHTDGPYGTEPSRQWLTYCWNDVGLTVSVMQSNASVRENAECPYGGTVSGTSCINAPACEEGQTRDPVTGQCTQGCTAGTVADSGYFHMGTDENTVWPASACIDGCLATFTGDAPGARQIVASKYHYYAKGTYYQTGFTCTGGSGPSGGNALPPPSCATGEALGTVGNNTVCYNTGTGKSTSPYTPKTTTTETTDNGDGTTTTETNDGDGGTTTTTSGGGTSTTETTPGAGSGTTSGGGGISYGQDGTGDASKDEPGSLCDQMPNAAVCKEKVPIDELQTPTDADGILDAQIQQLSDDATALESQITDRQWEKTDLGFSWAPSVPSGGGCSSLTLYKSYGMDICQPLGLVRDVWAWVFGFLATFYIWRRGTAAFGGQ